MTHALEVRVAAMERRLGALEEVAAKEARDRALAAEEAAARAPLMEARAAKLKADNDYHQGLISKAERNRLVSSFNLEIARLRAGGYSRISAACPGGNAIAEAISKGIDAGIEPIHAAVPASFADGGAR